MSRLLFLRRIVTHGSRRGYSSTLLLRKEYPPHTLYPMPALSPTMETGTISAWSKGVGDEFAAGDSLCTIETDKAAVDFEAQDDGIIAKILREGANAIDMPVGTPICVVVDDASDVAAFADFQIGGILEPPQEAVSASVSSTAESTPVAATGSSILFPSARHLAESNGLDATGLAGSGKGGRVTKGDVLQAMAAGSLPKLVKAAAPTVSAPAALSAPAPSVAVAPPKPMTLADLILPTVETGIEEDIPNTKMRKIIAQRLTESKREVPHFYTTHEVELDAIMKLRKKLANDHEIKISVNDFVLKCSAMALRDVPRVNAQYKSDTVTYLDSIDISVAVATPTGLITPILFGADKLGLSQVTSTVLDLATRARDGKLAPQEYQGGSFSVSNLGMFGIREFSAVINPPQAAILAVGGGAKQFVVRRGPEGEKLPPGVAMRMTACLSADRRVVDEATAGLFMAAFREYMNKPELLLL
ncbi:pyruvate dehydrogenase E2 component [Fistulifera solaris]|uniref:Dihydrolipoamide acetyltransferase component of pyruvate dehydrogenase complex n=1 Tax=Fistulifera solaris TaxID=1519565 RepID=A0A1Z5KGP5_FISSO|nr:pyruvate dehydrogenase E2 component [Fistulifera solaris]|eukprot:GAX25490.1 pyruvate dehydrogenase E2 component [Fistulifera solaris]